jgi:hypothetical protein
MYSGVVSLMGRPKWLGFRDADLNKNKATRGSYFKDFKKPFGLKIYCVNSNKKK